MENGIPDCHNILEKCVSWQHWNMTHLTSVSWVMKWLYVLVSFRPKAVPWFHLWVVINLPLFIIIHGQRKNDVWRGDGLKLTIKTHTCLLCMQEPKWVRNYLNKGFPNQLWRLSSCHLLAKCSLLGTVMAHLIKKNLTNSTAFVDSILLTEILLWPSGQPLQPLSGIMQLMFEPTRTTWDFQFCKWLAHSTS